MNTDKLGLLILLTDLTTGLKFVSKMLDSIEDKESQDYQWYMKKRMEAEKSCDYIIKQIYEYNAVKDQQSASKVSEKGDTTEG